MFQSLGDDLAFLLAQYTDAFQHRSMSDGTLNVIRGQTLIEVNGRGKGLYEGIGSLGETACPGFGFAAHRSCLVKNEAFMPTIITGVQRLGGFPFHR